MTWLFAFATAALCASKDFCASSAFCWASDNAFLALSNAVSFAFKLFSNAAFLVASVVDEILFFNASTSD